MFMRMSQFDALWHLPGRPALQGLQLHHSAALLQMLVTGTTITGPLKTVIANKLD